MVYIGKPLVTVVTVVTLSNFSITHGKLVVKREEVLTFANCNNSAKVSPLEQKIPQQRTKILP